MFAIAIQTTTTVTRFDSNLPGITEEQRLKRLEFYSIPQTYAMHSF